MATVQAIGGTGGLKIGADFLRQLNPSAKVLISDPSWENHRALFVQAGFTVESYPYYDAARRGVNFDAMLGALSSAAAGTVAHLVSGHQAAARAAARAGSLRSDGAT